MKKTGRVPTIEDSFCLNLDQLFKSARELDSQALTVDAHGMVGLAILSADRLILAMGGAIFNAPIVRVPCLKGRLRPLLKCPRAHEGHFQSLYYREGVLACRHCHRLRYRTTLAPSATERARFARLKLLRTMGAQPGEAAPARRPYTWRKRYARLISKLTHLSGCHYYAVRDWLSGAKK